MSGVVTTAVMTQRVYCPHCDWAGTIAEALAELATGGTSPLTCPRCGPEVFWRKGSKMKLGQKATDSITGFTGIVIGRTEWLYGCVRYALQPEGLKDGKPSEEQWFDEQRLTATPKAKSGGPQRDPHR